MSSREYRIGLVTIEAITSYPIQLWLGASDCATHLGLNLITYGGFPKQVTKPSKGNLVKNRDFLTTPFHQFIDLQSLDGILVWAAGILEDHSLAAKFLSPFRAIPMVSIGIDIAGIPRVLLDNYQGMTDMVTHLITKCGRRNLAFIAGPMTNIDAQIRLQAYKDTLQSFGISIRNEYIVPGDFGWNAQNVGKQAVQELIVQRGLMPDAIVASADDLAIGALKWLHQQGIRVPDQIAVTGFDNIPECLSTYPNLTTVAQDAYDLAWHAVECLFAKIQAKATPERIMVPNQIVVRDSCGAKQQKREQFADAFEQKLDNRRPQKPKEKVSQSLANYLLKAKAGFYQLFEEVFPDAELEKIDDLYDAFQWATLVAKPDHFLHALNGFVYNLSDRKILRKLKDRLLAFIQNIEWEVSTSNLEWTATTDSRLLGNSLQLLSTKLELLIEGALITQERDDSIKNSHDYVQLRILSRDIMTHYDPSYLMEVLEEKLPLLNIDMLYVALFQNREKPSNEVRLVLAYDQQKKHTKLAEGTTYKISELASGKAILQGRKGNLILLPLYSNDLYAGFAIFSFGPRNYQIYTQLCDILGYTIVNGSLRDQLRNHAHDLEGQITQRTADLKATNQRLQDEISERIRIEQDLKQARDQALEVSRLKSEFLATMSHEIRTPMNGILGMTELLLDGSLDEEQYSFAQIAHDEGHKLLEIINSILDLSKIEAGKITLENIEFSLATEVESVVRLLEPRAKSKGLTLLSAVTPNVPLIVVGDSIRFGQILRNLVSNAIKFTESGEVFITVHCLPDHSFATSASGELISLPIQVTVRDTGIGMSQETIKHIFSPFTQADSSTTRRFGGTGLGLVITKRLVDLLGGTVQVASEPNRGSTFTVTINYASSYASYSKAIERVNAASPNFLVLGANHALSCQVMNYLSTWSIQSTLLESNECNNAALLHHLYEAITNNRRYSCVIIAHEGSQIEPIAFARTLHADTLLHQCFPILMTENASDTFRQELIDAGFGAVLHVPITQSSLYQQVSHFIPNPYSQLSELQGAATVQVPNQKVKVDSQKRILVAEDYLNNQRVTLAYLTKLGFAAHVVENGKAAVDEIINHGNHYRLVLMDWHMPEMDGLQATRLIREHEQKTDRHIPIIGMTASALKGDRDLCIAAGMDDYMTKPVKRDELRNMLDRWLIESR